MSETGVLEQIFNSSNFNYLPRAMTAANIRQEVIADNIANVNTPNYKRSVVEFEELLAREIYGEEPDGKLKLVRTHDKHLPFEPLEFHAEPQIVQDNSTTMRMDKNNVDIDIEMASLTQLRHHNEKRHYQRSTVTAISAPRRRKLYGIVFGN